MIENVKIIISIIALFLTSVQIILLIMQMKNNLKWNRNDATFRCIDDISESFKTYDPFLLDKIHILKYNSEVLSTNEYRELISNEQYRLQLYEIAHSYEKLSIAILSGYINEKIAKRLYFKNLTNAYKKLTPYIEIRCDESKGAVLQHFCRVAGKWNEEGANSFKVDEY